MKVQYKMKMQPLVQKFIRISKQYQQSIKPRVQPFYARALRGYAGCPLVKLAPPSRKNDSEGLSVRSRRSLNPGKSVKGKGSPQAPYQEARAGASHSDGYRGQVSGVNK